MATAATAIDASTLDLTLTALREFAADRLPHQKLLELDEKDECPLDVVRDMCGPALGLPLMFIPEEFGGMGGGAFDVYRVCEELARIDLGVATGVLATLLGTDPIRVGGTEKQKKHWLERVAKDGLLFAYAATEPEAGSDLGALRTTAERITKDGSLGGYRINGSKQWISNGGIADAYTVLANTSAGPSWFVVERDTPGLTHDKSEVKHGIRLSNTAALSFDNVCIPAENLIGGVEGQGLSQAQAVFGYTRLMVAAFALGAGWAALDRAIPYSTERIQGGSPLSKKQGYTHKLIVPHVVRLEAARAYIEETAKRLDSGEGSLNTEGAVAKYLASEFANLAADAAIQALGGYGYTHEYRVEKIKRDVRITTIYEGTSEIMEITISRDRWQTHLKTRGQHYREEAAKLERMHSAHGAAGANTAAIALHTLAELLERARLARLTRHQHVLMRLGELIAYGECAASMVRAAVAACENGRHQTTHQRFNADALCTISRIFARDCALKIANDGMRWIVGASESFDRSATKALNFDAVWQAQSGSLADMDFLCEAIYR